jgi:hypothetical protein
MVDDHADQGNVFYLFRRKAKAHFHLADLRTGLDILCRCH